MLHYSLIGCRHFPVQIMKGHILQLVIGLCLALHLMTTNLVDAVGPKTTIGKKSKKIKDWEDPDRDNSNDLMVTKKAFFQIEIDDEPVGKVVISLFGETCPVTVQNFAALVRGTSKNRVGVVIMVVPIFFINLIKFTFISIH